MPRIIITQNAAFGLKKCRDFLKTKNPRAARHAAQTIFDNLSLLEINPEVGRPYSDAPELRELIIKFGDTGYVALYRYIPQENTIYVLAFRHQKEAGY